MKKFAKTHEWINTENGEIQPFSVEMKGLVESLASQAAVALTNKRLVFDLNNLFESFGLKLIKAHPVLVESFSLELVK